MNIVTDWGPQFMSHYCRAFWSLLALLSVSFQVSSPNQMVKHERGNQELEKYLRCFTFHQPSSWSQFLVWVKLALNPLRSSSAVLSPFKCQFGFEPALFFSQEVEVGVSNAEKFIEPCKGSWKRAHLALKHA